MRISRAFLDDFLWISCRLLVKCMRMSCMIVGFLWESGGRLVDFLLVSRGFVVEFLWISYEVLMNVLWILSVFVKYLYSSCRFRVDF